MKPWANLSWFSALVLLCGCGGGGTASPPPPPVGSSGPPPQRELTLAGNWQFTATSTAGRAAWAIAGSITQSGSSLGGAVHGNDSSCFDLLAPIELTGALTGSSIVLTSASVNAQVLSVVGSVTSTTLIGTYTIKGGCADGDEGKLTGVKVASMTGNWGGTFTTETGDIIDVSVGLTQDSPSSEGSFGLSGTVSLGSPCFTSGKITSGTFPSASYIMGTTVYLKIETDNGVIVFPATAESDGLVRGDYTVVGGTCEQAGTGYLSPWGY